MAKRLMHALVYGGHVEGAVGLKYIEVPIPSPGKDELLIKVEAASINPVDWKIYHLRNLLRPFISKSHPPIPGNDVAGEVVEIGSGVQKFKVGDKVVTVLSVYSAGGLAEYCVANEKVTVFRPAEVSAADGAGLPVASLTAHLSLTKYIGLNLDNPKHENEKNGPHQKNILITAASGGVGHYAVQLAKLGGAHVTATCGARNFELVKGLGADEVLDYTTPEGAALKSPSGRKYDAVIHCAPTAPWSVFEANLAENGVVIDLIPSLGTKFASMVKRIAFSKKRLFTFMLTPNDDEGLKFLVGLVKEGRLKTVVDSKHELRRGEEGWSKGVSGHATGKIIIEP